MIPGYIIGSILAILLLDTIMTIAISISKKYQGN